jgi:hypothetical protein
MTERKLFRVHFSSKRDGLDTICQTPEQVLRLISKTRIKSEDEIVIRKGTIGEIMA